MSEEKSKVNTGKAFAVGVLICVALSGVMWYRYNALRNQKGDVPLLKMKDSASTTLAFSKDDSQLVTASHENFGIWDVKTGKNKKFVKGKYRQFADYDPSYGNVHESKNIKLSPNGDFFVSCMTTPNYRTSYLGNWNIDSSKTQFRFPVLNTSRQNTRSHQRYVGLTPDGKEFWFRSWYNQEMPPRSIARFSLTVKGNAENGQITQRTLEKHLDWQYGVPAYWPNKGRFVEATFEIAQSLPIRTDDSHVTMIDSFTKEPLFRLNFDAETTPVDSSCLAQPILLGYFAPDGKTMAGLSYSCGYNSENRIFVWDVTTKNMLWYKMDDARRVNEIAFSDDSRKIAVGGTFATQNSLPRKGWLEVYDAKSGEILHRFSEESGQDRLDQTKQSWKLGLCRRFGLNPVSYGVITTNAIGDDGPIRALAWSHDGKKLAAAYEYGVIKVWPVR